MTTLGASGEDGQRSAIKTVTWADELSAPAMLVSDGYHVDLAPFRPGDQLLLYTDGVTETRDRSGAFYPFAERIRSWSGEAPHQLLDHLHRDLIAYSGGELHDDIAALVARRRPSR
ncbi:PP2C family protein-serine/threonine phosphatase [Streptomyces sp. NPDC050564]|uniref:PP2C family protein-serine/threonine phosphatase n=1 Tax=Streptomyces sp. NPDC050564 TaxID=3365631 RepID=UPI0037BC626F